jgi:LysM repeat protein
MAQDPPGILPTLFQERFCLTDRHVRCEMYKQVGSQRSAAIAQDRSAAQKARSGRFRPSVRSVPVALHPSGTTTADAGQSGPGRRVLALLVGAAAILVLLAFLFVALGGLGGGTPPQASASPSPSAAPTPTATPTPSPSLRPTATPSVSAPPPSASAPILIRYAVQEGERLTRIAQQFGIRRPDILELNEIDEAVGLQVGQIIIVPVPADTPREEIEANPGFVGYVSEG